jgi:hypothetical protein
MAARRLRSAAFLALFAALATAFSSCLSGHETIAGDVSPERWDAPAMMRYENTDTLTVRRLTLSIRHAAEISPSEGIYVVGATSPSGIQARDTLHVRFSKPAEITPVNTLRETLTPFPGTTRMDESGEWTFSVTPLQPTRGVWGIALVIK